VSSDLYPVRFPFGQMAQQPNVLLILVMQPAQELPPSTAPFRKRIAVEPKAPN
ncbi:hypothetical protein PGTUg99_003667, partial [Puccinia graminis f. sp. tritici]